MSATDETCRETALSARSEEPFTTGRLFAPVHVCVTQKLPGGSLTLSDGLEAVRETFGKQMIKAIPDPSIAEALAWHKRETAHWKELTDRVKIDQTQ